MADRTLPKGFVWGAATSAYQVEGAVHEGGRGESIWDRLCAQPGAIEDGTTGAVACDHYHRWAEDLDLVRELGLGAYRFSIAWPRVLPTGRGAVNAAGLDFYDRLVDGLLERQLTPFPTLYHWDLPQPLQDRGGWAARDTVEAFSEYTDVVTRRLGDRVKQWITINEPWCVAVLGHATGVQAPGLKDWKLALRAAHHVLLAHGQAVPIIRGNVPDAKVGIVLILSPGFAASQSTPDLAATERFDQEFNRWYLDPLFGRGYPEPLAAQYQREGLADGFTFVQPGDLERIATRTDFLGVNYYSRTIVRAPEAPNEPRLLADPPASVRTDMGWEVYPQGLTQVLQRVHREYAPKAIYVTENGAAYGHQPDADGLVRDEPRRAYLQAHLGACLDALEAGVPLHGYFAWSLLDNFEWAFGFKMRFGLVHVDYATQRRTIKQSGRWLAQVLATNTLTSQVTQ
jgi:beta-glucosidase